MRMNDTKYSNDNTNNCEYHMRILLTLHRTGNSSECILDIVFFFLLLLTPKKIQ